MMPSDFSSRRHFRRFSPPRHYYADAIFIDIFAALFRHFHCHYFLRHAMPLSFLRRLPLTLLPTGAFAIIAAADAIFAAADISPSMLFSFTPPISSFHFRHYPDIFAIR